MTGNAGYWTVAEQQDRKQLADWFVQFVPEEVRKAHELFAKAMGYFWLPCPLCGEESGGHEWRRINGLSDCIANPDGGPQSSLGICPACTRAGHGDDGPFLEMPAKGS
jgi:hypothetical protein